MKEYFGWLEKTGLMKQVSKGADVAARGKPLKGMAVSRPPEEWTNPVSVTGPKEGWKKSGKSRPATNISPNVDPYCTAKRVGAKRANIEGNESAKYEAMEKKSLKSLKGGGSEKELREGHNTKKKWIAGAIKHPGALHKQLGVPEGKKIPAGKLAKAASAGGKLGKRARLAQTLKKMH